MKPILILIFAAIFFGQCNTPGEIAEANVPYSYFCAPKGVAVNYDTEGPAPVFEGLTDRQFPITTNSEEAQKYYNQGMMLAYGFNHPEAARSFHYASKLDPDCAMCYWGLAYVLGPNYNAGMDPSVVIDANQALNRAKALKNLVTEKEKALIDALANRYPAEPVEDRSPYDMAWSESIKAVHEAYTDDMDIAVLYAESIMDMHPWDLYDENRAPKEWTPEIIRIIKDVLGKEPDHPAANHLYIHAVEASKKPSDGLVAAGKLEDLVPGAGHLVHMPSHIYIRTGDYIKGSEVNIRAIEIDSQYVEACHVAGVYPLAYYPHNFHFLSAMTALHGNGELSINAADRMVAKLDTNIMREEGFGTIQHYYSIPIYVRIKFKKWNDLLNTKKPAVDLPYPRAIWDYAIGMAHLGKGNLGTAKSYLEKVKLATQNDEISKITVWDINNCADLVQIASYVLEAKILEKEKKYDMAIEKYRSAIAIEDRLAYNEPPDWFFSVRHELAPVLMKANRFDEAIEALEKDLDNNPENGWALFQLYRCYEEKGEKDKASEIKMRFDKAWSQADFTLS